MSPRPARLVTLLTALASIQVARADVQVQIAPNVPVSLRDLREFAGTGYGGESAHRVRLDFICGTITNNSSAPPDASNFTASATLEFGVDGAYAASLTSNGTPVTVPGGSGVAYYEAQGKRFELRLPGAGARNVYVRRTLYSSWSTTSGSVTTPHYSNSVLVTTVALNVLRRNVEAVALDSRRVYGQPNLDGGLPGDPNAELRNPSFLGWSYKGGLFVGQAGGNDASGTARIQGWIPAATLTYPLMSSLCLRALGVPASYGAPTVRLFAPSAANDPNYGALPATATWANRWDLTQATLLGEETSLYNFPQNEYLSLRFLEAPVKIGLALSAEASPPSGVWQYFASQAYESSAPLADSQPRLWTVDRTSSNEVTNLTGN